MASNPPPPRTEDSPPTGDPVDLRALTTSELIDRGFSLYRGHFTAFLLIALLSQSAPLIEQLILTETRFAPSFDDAFAHPNVGLERAPLMLLFSVLTQIIPFCFTVVMTFYIADAYLGRVPTFRTSLRRFWQMSGPALLTFFLTCLVIGLTFLFPLLALVAETFFVVKFTPTTYLGFFLFFGLALLLLIASIVPVLVVFMRLMLTVPALALEKLSGWKAVRRSSQLVRYDPGLGILYWGEMRLSFLLLPLFVIELLILSLTSLPVTIHQFSEVVRHGNQLTAAPDSTQIISQILTFLAGSVILPLYTIATTLFYYDVRVRREGFDLEFMTEQLEKRA